MSRLTVAQVMARIDAVEESFAAQFRAQDEKIERLAAVTRSLAEAVSGLTDMQMVRERPSRASATATPLVTTNSAPAPIVHIGGRACYKLRAIENGRLVTTYRPVQ